MGLGYTFRDGDWPRLRQIIQKLSSLKIGPDAAPTFASLTLTDLTASKLVQTDADKGLISVSALATFIAGTANQVIVTDNGDGTITLSLPQDIDTAADVQFGSADITNTTTTKRILAGGVIE